MRILAMLLVFITAVTSETRVDKYIGTAVDLKTGKLIYTEEHEALYTNDVNVSSVITYRDVQRNIIGKKEIFFDGSSPAAKFRREDFRYGTMEAAEVVGDAVKLVNKIDASTGVKEELLKIPEPLALDAGLNNMVRNNWEQLRQNNNVSFNLGVPSQLDYFEFRLVKDREELFVGRRTMVVRFESDHWFIRLFVDPVIVWYDVETRRAVKYEGISNLYDEKGKSYVVRVTFDKPGP